MEDARNLIDDYKGLSNNQIIKFMKERRNRLEIAIINVSHDFNAGTIVRNANNFNAKAVHIIGKRKYNRRGAMCTDKYLDIHYWTDFDKFAEYLKGRELVAIENNVKGCKPLGKKKFIPETTLIFGGESDGIPPEILEKVDDIRSIESFGSTRSVNVGVASGIAMYEWARQIKLKG